MAGENFYLERGRWIVWNSLRIELQDRIFIWRHCFSIFKEAGTFHLLPLWVKFYSATKSIKRGACARVFSVHFLHSRKEDPFLSTPKEDSAFSPATKEASTTSPSTKEEPFLFLTAKDIGRIYLRYTPCSGTMVTTEVTNGGIKDRQEINGIRFK